MTIIFYPSTSGYFTIVDKDAAEQNITPYIKSIDGLPGPRGLVDATALGAAGKAWAVGLQDVVFTIELMWSSDASVGPDTVFGPLSRWTASTAFIYAPKGSTGGFRKYYGNCWVKTFNIHTKVGELLMATVECQVDGVVNYGTMP